MPPLFHQFHCWPVTYFSPSPGDSNSFILTCPSSWSFGILLFEMATLGKFFFCYNSFICQCCNQRNLYHAFIIFLKWSPFPSRWSPICRNPSKWTAAVSSTGEKSEKTSQLLQRAVCIKGVHLSLCYCNPSTIIKKTSTPFVHSILRYSIIKACCQWRDQDRPSLAEVNRKLASAERSASDKVLRVPTTVNIEQYLQEAGFGEANSYTVFWQSGSCYLHYTLSNGALLKKRHFRDNENKITFQFHVFFFLCFLLLICKKEIREWLLSKQVLLYFPSSTWNWDLQL